MINFSNCCGLVIMKPNVVLYGKLRFCERGISSGNSEVCKRATSFSLAKYSNFLYKVLLIVFLFLYKFCIINGNYFS